MTSWKEVFKSLRGWLVIVFCLSTLLMMVFYMPHFYREIIGPKKGFILNDPFLEIFSPMDWSLPIFSMLYLAVVQTVVTNIKKPEVLLLGLSAYCAINIFRMATMYIVTLEPPAGMILLADPISSIAYPDTGFAKDLFFSGHISTLVLLALADRNYIARALKIAGAVLMALLLAWQHVHYTIDLVAAPLVTYGIFLITRKVLGLTEMAGNQQKP